MSPPPMSLTDSLPTSMPLLNRPLEHPSRSQKTEHRPHHHEHQADHGRTERASAAGYDHDFLREACFHHCLPFKRTR